MFFSLPRYGIRTNFNNEIYSSNEDSIMNYPNAPFLKEIFMNGTWSLRLFTGIGTWTIFYFVRFDVNILIKIFNFIHNNTSKMNKFILTMEWNYTHFSIINKFIFQLTPFCKTPQLQKRSISVNINITLRTSNSSKTF